MQIGRGDLLLPTEIPVVGALVICFQNEHGMAATTEAIAQIHELIA
jgi:hypothetical protein